MRIGLLITSIGAFGQKGFYNSQEIGLAKAMSALVEDVRVYKLISKEQAENQEIIEGYDNVNISFIQTRNIGNNGLVDCSKLDTNLNALVYFSDTQIAVTKVYNWSRINNINFYPYIGVIKSHSTNKIKETLVNILNLRNLNVYKKSRCFAKTPKVQKELRTVGVDKVSIASVGLDISLMKSNFQNYSIYQLKEKYGYSRKDKVILFIGRLIEEKQPIRMIEIFSDAIKENKFYKLLIVGSGKLKENISNKIIKNGMQKQVRIIDSIPYNDIWELYRMSEVFVNLNQQEIFGMAILEAMYYGCKIVAWEAPGPNFIIENGKCGWLVNNNNEAVKKIISDVDINKNGYDRVINKFSWKTTAKDMIKIIKNDLS